MDRYPDAGWVCAEPRWDIFHDNEAIWHALFELCDSARHSIDLEQFIIGNAGVGRKLLDLLATKAREGVSVRVLADGMGSRGLVKSDGAQALRRNGGQIAMFHAVPDLLFKPIACAPRLHRKTLICDRAHVRVGGSCYQERMSNWRDTMLRVSGPLPPAIPAAFERAWRPDHHRQDNGSGAEASCKSDWHFAISPNTTAEPDLRQILPERIAEAERTVRLTSPYLLPDRRLWRALIAARKRGAKVQILLPARSDHAAVDRAGRFVARALKSYGIEVRFYTKGMLHAKLALIDERWSSVSSFNLDLLSAKFNLESGIVSTYRPLAEALAAQLDADLSGSVKLSEL